MAPHSTYTVSVTSLLAGTSNTRDLGGCRTIDGRKVRRGLLFRSDALTALTDMDRTTLREMNLQVLVDLRTEQEIKWHGPNMCEPGTRVVHAPLIDEAGETLAFTLSRAFNEQNAAAITELLGSGRADELANGTASRFLDLAATQSGISAVLQLLAEGQAPLMFVCPAGKNRTGFVAAVILRTLGVSEADIIAGYVLSNSYLAATNQEMIGILRSAGVDPEIVRPLIEQQPHVMASFFSEVDDRYGDWHNYLVSRLELAPEVPKLLQDRYLEPADA